MDDLKVSLRQLLKTPGFTFAAIAVLALGIGLNAAMFSIVHAFAFAARPFAAPERLTQVYSRDERTTGDYRAFSFQAYQEVAFRGDLFAGVLAHSLTVVGVGHEQDSRRAFAAIVSDNYFDVLRVPLIRGRGFTAEEARPGHDAPVVVVSYAYWKRTGFDPRAHWLDPPHQRTALHGGGHYPAGLYRHDVGVRPGAVLSARSVPTA